MVFLMLVISPQHVNVFDAWRGKLQGKIFFKGEKQAPDVSKSS